MVEPDDNSDTLTAMVWTLRVVLPCLLFWISFGPKLRCPWRFKQHSREIMLAHRDFVKASGAPAPKSVANLVTVDAQTAPMLFTETAKRQKSEKNDRHDRERERGEKGERSRGQDRRERRHSQAEATDRETSSQKQAQVETKPEVSEEVIYWESIVNFIAFGHHEQQRHFLVNSTSIPPPPPRVQKVPAPSDPEAAALLAVAIERANGEAQMVLRGAIQSGRAGCTASHALYKQMVDHDIEIQPLTFELIIESCITANELQQASDYLMRMEANGQTPSNELLDRVMDLYLQHKRSESDEKLKVSDSLQSVLPAGLVASATGHQLDVAGLKRLAGPPPPPPPVRAAPGIAPVYGGHGVGDYSHMMNHSMPMEIPSLLLPWQARLPYRNFSGNTAMPKQRRKDDHCKDLPAFSIPEEFVAQRSQENGSTADTPADGVDKGKTVDEEFPEITEFRSSSPPLEGAKADGQELVSGSVLSADATEFVMPQSDSLHVDYSAASENWQYLPQHSNLGPGDWAEGSSMPSDLYGAVGGAGSTFEWSVQAPVFTPMANRSLPEVDQATSFEWEGSEFVPGQIPIQQPLPVGPVSLGTGDFYRPEDEMQMQ